MLFLIWLLSGFSAGGFAYWFMYEEQAEQYGSHNDRRKNERRKRPRLNSKDRRKGNRRSKSKPIDKEKRS